MAKSKQIGTLLYNAPELINDLPHSSKVDVWAAGVILYEMLAGTHPFFDSRSQVPLSKMITESEVEEIKGAEDDTIALIKKILTKNPSMRPSVQDLMIYPAVQKAMRSLRNNLPPKYEAKLKQQIDKLLIYGEKRKVQIEDDSYQVKEVIRQDSNEFITKVQRKKVDYLMKTYNHFNY
jgi:serine/threonine protein kinase